MNTWKKQGIGAYQGSSFDLTPKCRAWLYAFVGTAPKDWYWDHFLEESETAIMFNEPSKAVLFKLTWL